MTVTINGKDARIWGIVFDSSAICSLMTPAPMKSYIENKSRAEHGKRVITNETLAKVDERQVNLSFSMCARTEDDFFAKYAAFSQELHKTGELRIILSIQPTIVYKLLYDSCSSFTQYNNKLAKFVLKCTEPNPEDRSIE